MPKLIANTKDMSEAEWLELRKDGIGGSDCSAVAGVNPYKSPVVAYMEKTNQYEGKPAGEAAEWGNILEPVVRKVFAEKINTEREGQGLKPLKVQQRHAIFAHDKHNFMRTNLDGIIYGHELGKGILEIKTANQYMSDEWRGEDVPNQYYIQAQHNMAVMDVQFCYIPVLIGGQKYKHYFIKRDDELIQNLIAIEQNFWENHIQKNIPPEMDGADSTKDMVNAVYGVSDPDAPPVELSTNLQSYVEDLDKVKQEEKALKERKQHAQNLIKDAMEGAETAFIGPHQVTWKANKNGVRTFKYKLNTKAEV